MQHTHRLDGVVSLDLPTVSSEVSQWLYLHTSLGKGYVSPVPYGPSWVITSGVPASLVHRMKTAENEFHGQLEDSMAAEREELEQLEKTAQAKKNAPRGVGAIGIPDTADTHAAQAVRIKELKELLSRPVYVNYRDYSADRSVFLELLSKSRFRSMSFVDEHGIRYHGYTVNKMLATRMTLNDLSLISLTGDQSADSVMVRSSTSGGANIMSVRGKDSPRFNMMTLTSPQAIKKTASRFKSVTPYIGHLLMLPSESGPILDVYEEDILKVINKVYATENPLHRFDVELPHPDKWVRFFACDPSDYQDSQAALAAYKSSMCSVTTLMGNIVRAVITRRFYLDEKHLTTPGPDRSIKLTDEDLQLAQAWMKVLLPSVTGTAHLAVRRENLQKANEAKAKGPSATRLDAARQKLTDLLQEKDGHCVSRTTGIRAVGALTLDTLTSRFPDTFGAHSNGAVFLQPDGIPQAGVTSGPVGGPPPTSTPGSELSNETLDSLYQTWQEMAHERLQAGYPPTVGVNEVLPVFREATHAVRDRYWQTITLLPSGPKIDGSDHNEMEMWFRNRPDGLPMCAWKFTYRDWLLHEKWEAKDEEAELSRQKGGQA